MLDEILEFKKILRKCYSKETTYEACIENYDNKDVSCGHCAITALLVFEKFGGTINKIITKEGTHYFNIIDDKIIDLTKEQFDYELNYSNNILKKYEDILKDKDTKRRYLLLKNKIELYLIDEQIFKCNLCNNLVEHFPNSKTISMGNNNNIVILGEAPANNGWRKSGKAFYDINNKMLPSGAVLQKLLDILEIKLEDTYFLEAIKCYPKERKHLKKCSQNCKKYLLKQLEIIKPKIVLSLGDASTKTILDVKYKKFGDVVGKVFLVNNIKVIPIYHPSPISLVGYKGNILIFKNIRKWLYENN